MVLVEPLIEVVIEFVIKRAAQRAPPLIRDLQRRWRLPRRTCMVVSRVGLVNRERELRAIRAAIAEAPYLRILYLPGPGGVGKTRLLEESTRLLPEIHTNTPLYWSGILDLYHADLHSVSALQVALIQGLDPEEQHFHGYRAARERFERRRAEGLLGLALDVEREALNATFLEDYEVFVRERRPVIALDTLESLHHESDLIQSVCQLEDTMVAVRDWLLKQAGRLNNSVILLAGRHQPALRRDLERAHGDEPGRLEVIEMSGLTREDSRQLLELFLRKAPPSAQALRDDADRLWQLVAGLPVQLALIVELVAYGEKIDITALKEISDATTWGRRLVNTLFDYYEPVGRTLFFLALARKGLTADLLHHLEPGWSRADCEHRLVEMRDSCVVKLRPGREEVFLHDALYELFDAYSPPDIQPQPWYERLADYYRGQQARAGNDRAAWGRATVSLLYYELQRDPRHAFEAGYVHWDEAAIKGYELGLDMQLRDELLRHVRSPLTQQRAAAQGLSQAAIDRDSAVRWIKRFLIQSRHQQATTVAQTILVLGPEPYSAFALNAEDRLAGLDAEQREESQAVFSAADPLFWGHLLTYYGEALAYTGASESRTKHVLEQAITLLENVSLEREEPLAWLRERVLGRAHNTLGYLLQAYGHYTDALESYRRALSYFEASGVADEQADTLNNLAFLLALLSEAQQAKDYIDQSLALRQRLGQRYPLALGHNTRGLIYAAQGQPDWGQRECRLALSIFEELEVPRGIGLACNALGFVLRQQGDAWKLGKHDRDQAAGLFEQSARFLERSTRIFSEQVAEPIRLWEAYNEQGSLFADWGYLLLRHGDQAAAQAKYEQAVQYQLRALEVAQRHSLHFQEADTCDDLAEAWADQNNIDKARQWLEQDLALVPEEYTLTVGRGFVDAPAPGEAYWLILGKAHSQQGVWALRAIAQEQLADDRRKERVKEGIEHFALAAAYFLRYWPRGVAALNAKWQLMAHYLGQTGIAADEVRAIIDQAGSRYGIELTAFVDVISTDLRVGQPAHVPEPGGQHERP